MATKRSNEPATPASATPHIPTDAEMRSPFIPLLWLVIPFLCCIIYGIITSPRFSH